MTNSVLLPPSNRVTIAFGLFLIMTFILGVTFPRILAYLPSVIGLGFSGYIFLKNKKFFTPHKTLFSIFAFTVLFILLSTQWAPNEGFALKRVFKIFLILIPSLLFLTFSQHVRLNDFFEKKLLVGFIISYLLASLYLLNEILLTPTLAEFVLQRDLQLFTSNRGYVVFALFTLPLLQIIKTSSLTLHYKNLTLAFITALALFATYFASSQTAQLSLICGLFFFYLFPLKNLIYTKGLLALLIIFSLGFPFTINYLHKNAPEEYFKEGVLKEASIVHRLEVWNYSVEKTFKSPIYGNGIEALRFMKSDVKMVYMKAQNALHAHNVVLQAWAEFGIIGVLLFILLLVYIFKKIMAEQNLDNRRLMFAIFMSCLCCAMTGYGFWQSWQLGLFIILFGFGLALRDKSET